MIEPLTAQQLRALAVMAGVVDSSFYLAGGVAVAMHLRHRVSHDLDLFSPTTDASTLADRLVQSARDTRILTRSAGTLHAEVEGVPVSALRYAYPSLDEPSHVGLAIPVASLRDLIAMKLSAIGGRGAARDFWDLHAMLASRQMSLTAALDDFGRKYVQEDVGHVVRALVYFADADAAPLPRGLDDAHWARIKEDLRERVRVI